MAVKIRKKASDFRQLNRCTSLQKVGQETMGRLWERGGVRQYDKGEMIIRAKEATANVYFLLSGKVIQYNLTHLGKRKILFVFGAGTLLNDHMFDSHAPSLFCEAIEPCTVFLIKKEETVRLMEGDFSLVAGIIFEQEKKHWRLAHQLKNTVGNIYAERKLAAKLWKLARDFGIPKEDGIEIDINMSVTFLADMLGTPRETASRLCTSLVENGLIRHEKKKVTVCDVDGLVHFYKTGEYL